MEASLRSVKQMAIPSPLLAFSIIVLLLESYAAIAGHSHPHIEFQQCISRFTNSSISKLVYTSSNSSYESILKFPIENLRFLTPRTPKPYFIVTPAEEFHVQAAVVCSKRYALQIRIRSGGHDYEGLSTVSVVPFVVVDLIKMKSIDVNVERKTAMVQGGATIGELYYTIAEKSRTLAFPAGVCPSVGIGGHFGGGGWGVLFRKYGLAVDNVIDARLVNAEGRILDRKSMGEDLFWAIRGGSCASFGIIVSWTVQLVTVPPVLSSVNINRTLEQSANAILQKWQTIAYTMPNDVFSRLNILRVGERGNRTLIFMFVFVYLGPADGLVQVIRRRFPEMKIRRENCAEYDWIQLGVRGAIANGFPSNGSLDVMLTRAPPRRSFLKTKSDYVQTPIPKSGLEGIWKWLLDDGIEQPVVFLTAYGGKMSEIPESQTPFPHRAGNLYKVQYLVTWSEEGSAALKRHMEWIRGLYSYMATYASKNPRRAYMNYRDLDIGRNKDRGNTSYRIASIWGRKYFKGNFDRLVSVKSAVDPDNFFKNEQSIPVRFKGD